MFWCRSSTSAFCCERAKGRTPGKRLMHSRCLHRPPSPQFLALRVERALGYEALGFSGGLRVSRGLILESLHRQIKRGDLCRHRFVLAL